MEKMSIQKLAKEIGGICNFTEDIFVENVCIDNRKVTNDCIFIAIKGENFDGHSFIKTAVEAGAVAVISSQEIEGVDNLVLVKDTKKALLDLAEYYRKLFPVFTVGVTGSVGKTSTKEMVYTVLKKASLTHKSEGNFNNEIGLPLAVLDLNSNHKSAVFEMGMSDIGEIEVLSKVTRPSVGVITNIGTAHIENLKSRENILKAKLEILKGMRYDAPLVLNADNDLLKNVIADCENPLIYFGIENEVDSDVIATDIIQKENDTTFTIKFYGKSIEATIPVIGKHNIYNALAGFCVGLIAQMQPIDIVNAMKNYQNTGLRQEISEHNGVKIIADCYNASPESMEAVINMLKDMPTTGKKYCVLGDMLELGDYSEEAHEEVGREVGRKLFDGLFCYGEESKAIKRGALLVGMKELIYHSNEKQEIAEELKSVLKPGDTIIFKASRGMKLEEIINIYKSM